MKKQTPISTILISNLVKLNLTDDLTKAKKLFKKHKIRHIPVVESNIILGMLSYSDLLRISYVDPFDIEDENVPVTINNLFTISQVMTKNPIAISPETTIKEAADILANNEFHALPVCVGNLLVGIITTTDLIRYLTSQFEE
jgi:CBS domain-containing membrane protein